MGLMRKTAIVVPCYNEAGRLDAKAFLAAAAQYPYIDFIFVNDGSTDSTARVLDALRSQEPGRVRVVTLERNSGKAEAVRRGFIEAFKDDYANVGYWDADLATPLDELPQFCGLLEGSAFNVVIGSRVKLLGRSIERNAVRHYVGRVFATCASLFLRMPVYDTQCGAKIFNRSPSLEAAMSVPFKVRWIFDVELLARLKLIEEASGNHEPESSWVEHPLHAWADVKGSKVSLKDYFRGGYEFVKLFACVYAPGIRQRYSARLTRRENGQRRA